MEINMKKLTILFLATMFTAGLFAQNLAGKISGTVTSDGQPLVGANVILEGTSSGAATDESGAVSYTHPDAADE